ncbi:PA0069 family radical SAM protein [Azorhizobium doebereinerae]|uniref:PA0069 family radical SAM protein n=1 Tax=Azorhizobium doebereinerae TaxID=281091 RepID=UPI0009FDA708|nr:PA0069 family radical SAM protein [Azorhizobium doebereinerae]
MDLHRHTDLPALPQDLPTLPDDRWTEAHRRLEAARARGAEAVENARKINESPRKTKGERILGRLKAERETPLPAPRAAAQDRQAGEAGTQVDADTRRGRGATSNAAGRYEPAARILFDDGWQSLDDLPPFRTEVTEERARTIITRNQSPDIGFDRSINAYRGCEHGCIYCFARPTHAYQGLSAGLDFETKLFVKPDAPELLARELAQPRYQPRTIAMGTNTDPYQPIERRYEVTRRILEVLADFGHPVGIVTKSALVARDIDILGPMAARGLAKVAISITTLDPNLARLMEPRAAAPHRRLATIQRLADAGIPTAVLTAPLIPALNDNEVERILDAAKHMGATEAGYVTLRLPLEISDLFKEWLVTHFPDKARHVMALVREMHGGKDYVSTFGKRGRGDGPYAWTIGRRFEIAARRLGLNGRNVKLTTAHFRRPAKAGEQLSLFD